MTDGDSAKAEATSSVNRGRFRSAMPGPQPRPDRPTTAFDVGMQHERTQMAWERTAFNMLVAGAIIARYAVSDGYYVLAGVGGAIVVVATYILLWAARHYEDLHGPLRAGESPVHPTATRLVGITAIAGSAVGLLIGAERVLLG